MKETLHEKNIQIVSRGEEQKKAGSNTQIHPDDYIVHMKNLLCCQFLCSSYSVHHLFYIILQQPVVWNGEDLIYIK